MRSYLYPTFTLDNENFERALPIALSLSKKFQLPCRIWKSGDWFAISFQDKAINHGFYYSHQHENDLRAAFERYADFKLIYAKENIFAQGKDLV